MFLKEFAKIILKCKYQKFLYWMKKNKQDFEENGYPINLKDLIETGSIFCSDGRPRTVHYIEDIEQFKTEFIRYTNWIKDKKRKIKNSKNHWTRSAVECWENQGECKKCCNKNICRKFLNGTVCPMHKTVKTLLEEVGEPLLFDRSKITPSIIQI